MTRAQLVALLALALACTGCGPTSTGSSASNSPRAAPTTSLPSPSASSDQASSAQATAESCPARVYAGMSEAQRDGQVFIVGIAGDPATGGLIGLAGHAVAHVVATRPASHRPLLTLRGIRLDGDHEAIAVGVGDLPERALRQDRHVQDGDGRGIQG